MSLLDPIGGLGAINRHNSNLKTDLVFYADAVGTRISCATPAVARTQELRK